MRNPTRTIHVLVVLSVLQLSCGDGAAPAHYHGYFENAYGEQWTVEIGREAKTGVLRGGDVGWEAIVIRDNQIASDVILGDDEFAWLSVCWLAATGEKLKKPLGLADLFQQFAAMDSGDD